MKKGFQKDFGGVLIVPLGQKLESGSCKQGIQGFKKGVQTGQCATKGPIAKLFGRATKVKRREFFIPLKQLDIGCFPCSPRAKFQLKLVDAKNEAGMKANEMDDRSVGPSGQPRR